MMGTPFWIEEIVGTDDDDVQWVSTDIDAVVSRNDDGTFFWDVTHIDGVIRGGYPGYPDTVETPVGSGDAPTLADAQWAAWRCYDRAMVAEAAHAWEETMFYATDPDGMDPNWWKANR